MPGGEVDAAGQRPGRLDGGFYRTGGHHLGQYQATYVVEHPHRAARGTEVGSEQLEALPRGGVGIRHQGRGRVLTIEAHRHYGGVGILPVVVYLAQAVVAHASQGRGIERRVVVAGEATALGRYPLEVGKRVGIGRALHQKVGTVFLRSRGPGHVHGRALGRSRELQQLDGQRGRGCQGVIYLVGRGQGEVTPPHQPFLLAS